jgi:hypothetical protein
MYVSVNYTHAHIHICGALMYIYIYIYMVQIWRSHSLVTHKIENSLPSTQVGVMFIPFDTTYKKRKI